MTIRLFESARCACLVSLMLAAALPAAAADGGVRESCPKANTEAANPEPQTRPLLTEVDIVFVAATFKKPGLAEQAPDAEWVNWKLDDISRWVEERGAKVLRANSLEGRVIVLPAPLPGDAPDLSSLDASRPALVFAPTEFTKWRPKPLSPMAGSLFYSVRLVNAGLDATPKCRVEVFGGLGMDSVWGVFRTNRVDAEWVDTRLADGLTLMAKHGAVKLNGEKAVRPPL